MFSPQEAEQQRCNIKRANRKTKVQPSQQDRRKQNPQQAPGVEYDATSFAIAVKYGLKAAARNGVDIPHWSPGQLRHSCGTRVRRIFGADAARAVLGHKNSHVKVTDIYTREAIEKEELKITSRIMVKIG